MDTLQWLSQLVSFNTISSKSNMKLIAAIDQWFKLHGISTHIIHGTSKKKANLFATIPGRDGQTQGGLILSGHIDVVPVAGQIWKTDPFIATEKDGKIYGRGTCDMKGFIAVLLTLVPEIQQLKLIKPVHFSFTYDEEVGCIGVEYLVEYLRKAGIQPEGCIVGEPSGMRPIIGEKARQVYHCQVQGLAAHSSRPDKGCNAIEFAASLICYIHKLADFLKENGPFDDDYDLPFTTISTTIVSAGITSNVIPGNCEVIFEIRYMPQFQLENLRSQIQNYIDDELLPEMKKKHPDAAIFLDKISDEPPFSAMEDAPITRLVRIVTGVNERLKVSYSTEAGIYQDANIPTIICGPGNIEQAHQPNEYVSIEQLNICNHVLRNIIHFFCCMGT